MLRAEGKWATLIHPKIQMGMYVLHPKRTLHLFSDKIFRFKRLAQIAAEKMA